MARYDAIVIGSGLGGLTAAALAAAAGRSVLVLERNSSLGGAAGVYRIGELRVEASLHELPDPGDAGPQRWLFEELGVLERVRLVDLGPLYEVRSPLLGEPFVMPEGVEPAVEALSTRFEIPADALSAYFARLESIRLAAIAAASLGRMPRLRRLLEAPRLPFRLRPLLRSRGLSLAGALAELFGDNERAKLALAANLAYYSDDPATLPFALWAVAQGTFHAHGARFPYGGSQALVDALVERIESNGGRLESGREVTRIALADGKAVGVEHELRNATDGDRDAREEFAPVILGNAAPHALERLLPEDARSTFFSPYRDRPVSISYWTIALGFDRRPSEFGAERHSTCVFPDWMTDVASFPQNAALLGDEPAGRLPHFLFVNYAAVETGLTPSAPFFGAVSGIDAYENWKGLSRDAANERKERWMDAIVEALDREFPGIAGAIVQRTMTTAGEVARYLKTPNGAIYGFAPVLPMPTRLFAPQTPIEGLWLASAYTGVGGFTGAMAGGAAAARTALGT